jgi:hypothetical protein
MIYHNRFETREAMATWLESEYVTESIAEITNLANDIFIAMDNDKYFSAFTNIEEMFEVFEKLKRLLPRIL